MLYPNGQRVLSSRGRPISGLLVASGSLQYGGLQGARLNRFVSNTYNKTIGGMPSGYGLKSIIMPIKSGAVSGRVGLSIAPSGSGLMGLPGYGTTAISLSFANAQAYPLDDTPQAPTASASISFTVANATGKLISSGSGTAAMSFTVADALLTASIGGSGSATIGITTNTPLLRALASANGSASISFSIANAQAYPINDASPLREGAANFAISGVLIPYAIGYMSGSTVDTSVLTADAISAQVRIELAAELARIDANISSRATNTGAAVAVWDHTQ